MIGVLDSGVGGINVLCECIKEFNENYIYFCDNKYSPYGKKSKNKLLKITINNINYLINNYNINILILACNTISSMIYYDIKKIFPNIIIIPTFPPFKQIQSLRSDILLLGTKNTKKYNKKINYLIKNNNKYKFLYINNLAKKIDENLNNLNKIIPFLQKKINNNKFINIKTIVLCCTHYKSIKNQLQCCFSYKINFFEYENYVAKKVKLFIKDNIAKTSVVIVLSKSDDFKLKALKHYLKQNVNY